MNKYKSDTLCGSHVWTVNEGIHNKKQTVIVDLKSYQWGVLGSHGQHQTCIVQQ